MRTLILGVFYGVLIISVTPYILFCWLTGARDSLISLGQWAVRLGCRFLRIRVDVSGLERIERRTPYIFMANHVSFLDGPILASIMARPVRIILKKSLFGIPILGLAMAHAGFIAVDRRGAKGGQRSMHTAARLMRDRGYSFLLFPEGTRSRDGALQAFRRGGFFLALESRTPIVPVTITGTHELMPKGQWYARRGLVTIVFHPPVSVEGYRPASMGALIDNVRNAIASPGY
jgi:1-acyl-sn-glycerol-3-phosphate acyltransferase